jgi:hypothetical protein
MDELHKFTQRNLRRILALGGLILSLLAISILLNSTPGGSTWVASAAIPAGAKITASEVKLTKANLADAEPHYFKGGDVVIGRFAVRRLQAGDLIARTDITSVTTSSSTTTLPVGVGVVDLPIDLMNGDLVDIYVIPKDAAVLPAVVARRVAIESIDQKSRALGGSVAVSLTATAPIAAIIVTAESQGRLVLARDSL